MNRIKHNPSSKLIRIFILWFTVLSVAWGHSSFASSNACVFSLESRSKNAFLQFSAKYPALSVQFVEKIVLDSGLLYGRTGLESFDTTMIKLRYYQAKGKNSSTYQAGSSNPRKSTTVLKEISKLKDTELQQIAEMMEQKLKDKLWLENGGELKSARSKDLKKAAKSMGMDTDQFYEVRGIFSEIVQKNGGESFIHEMILSSFPFHSEVLLPFQNRLSPLKWGLGTLGLTLAVAKMPLIALDASVVSTLLVSANNAVSSFSHKREAKQLQTEMTRSLAEQLGEILWLTHVPALNQGNNSSIPVMAKNFETMDLDALRALNPKFEHIQDLADLARFGSVLYKSANYFVLSVQEIEVLSKTGLDPLINSTKDIRKVISKKPKAILSTARKYQNDLSVRLNKLGALNMGSQRLLEISEILDSKFELYSEHYREEIDAPVLSDAEGIDDAHTLFATTLRTLDAKKVYHLQARKHLNSSIVSLAQEREMISDLQSFIGVLSATVTAEQAQQLNDKLEVYTNYLESHQIIE